MNKVKLILTFITIILSGCATKMPPAELSSNEMKQADAIWIITDDESETAYKKIAQAITDEGFSIENSDATLMNISTGYKSVEPKASDLLSGGAYSLSINASVRERGGSVAIKIIGKWSTSGKYGAEDKEAMNTTGNTYAKRAWKQVKSIARKYNNAELKYSRNI